MENKIAKFRVFNKECLLKYVSEIKHDKEKVKLAVQKNGILLKYVNEEFKNDKEIVKLAVKQNGYSFFLVSDELKNDKEIVKLAVQQNGILFKFVSKELRNNLIFMTEIYKLDPFLLCFNKNRKIYTGKYLNQNYPNWKLRKYIKKDMIMRGFQYKEGLNIDTNYFNPADTCKIGGLYFTSEKYQRYFSGYGEDLYEVILTNESQVYMDSFNKAKADKIIIKKIKNDTVEINCSVSNSTKKDKFKVRHNKRFIKK